MGWNQTMEAIGCQVMGLKVVILRSVLNSEIPWSKLSL